MSFVVLLWSAVACTGGGGVIQGDDSQSGEDVDCPDIESIPVSSPQIYDTDIPVSANITDDSGVLSVILYYKLETSVTWKDIDMVPTTGSSYSATIPGADVRNAAGMHYYIWAQDGSPKLNACTLPHDGEDGPFHFTLDDSAKGN